MTVTITSPGLNLYGSLRDGEMLTGEFAAVCQRLFKGDPQWGLRAVLKIDAVTVTRLFTGAKPVPAPLAIALLRCCHGLPILKQIVANLNSGDKRAEHRAKDNYAKVMNAPIDLSTEDGRFEQHCAWAAQLTQFLMLRLDIFPDDDQ
jgi:hypothetical protein